MTRKFLLASVSGLLIINALTSNAQSWTNIGGGTSMGDVHVLYADGLDNLLYVGGIFDTVGFDFYPSRGFATWDGASWNDLSGNFGEDVTDCITRYNGKIYHGCNKGNIFKGEQSEANRVVNFNDGVNALAVYNGELYAGGIFTQLDSPDYTPMRHLAKWDGVQWTEVDGGIKSSSTSSDAGVYALYVWNGELYIGGIFDTAGSLPCKNIVRWNGSDWLPVGNGILQTLTDSAKVGAFNSYNGNLIVGGLFNSAGGIPAENIARWNGSSWSSLSSTLDGEVFAIQEYNGDLYTGGTFTLPMNHLAKWNGVDWSNVGGGINDGGGVRSFTLWNGMLVVGGKFTQIQDSIEVSNLVGWTTSPIGISSALIPGEDVTIQPSLVTRSSKIEIRGSNIAEVRVTDFYGRSLITKEFPNKNTSLPIEINSGNLISGTYIIEVRTATGIVNGKIVVL